MKKSLSYIFLAVMGLLAGVSLKAQQAIKIMSYNIHHCNPPSKPGL